MAENTVAGVLCPHCRVDLVMAERHGVEIDYCPKCRGIWLDRGELDKILERSAAYEAQLQQPAAPPPPQPQQAQTTPNPWGNAAPPPAPAGGYPAYAAYPAQPSGHHGAYDNHGGGHHGERGGHHKSFLGRFFD
ncbi:zf-TFIIB domain-containing protein [Magnetospirillum sp. 64-120]|uniref:TFIIB-type zinc ribbon-containing protein n=1 Tax=Magnetospirillum sp. 64-120 TaxID=1895778 RepID=UPI000928ED50|nr:zf-TFIIB domain-containing protein [Magnetospirillum sp. 64-120]OJX79936.1 MAG: hypothetical protein BGO92_03230 [Magnetospirillum sp. 64-120]